jgi:hypothetical protein
MWQQIIVTICVVAAALYLFRYVYSSVRAIVKARGGCGDACSNCAFAEPVSKRVARKSGSAPSTIIPLTEVRTAPRPKR